MSCIFEKDFSVLDDHHSCASVLSLNRYLSWSFPLLQWAEYDK